MNFSQALFIFKLMDQFIYNSWRVHKPSIEKFVTFCKTDNRMKPYYKHFEHFENEFQRQNNQDRTHEENSN